MDGASPGWSGASGSRQLGPDEMTLIERLRFGASIAEAARDAGLSVRTAHRRLAMLRGQFEVRTNAQLLQRIDPTQQGASTWDLPSSLLREAEVARLCATLSRDQSIAVVGPSGIGKSTLLRLSAQRQGGKVFVGEALSSLRWMSYLPLIRAVGPPPEGSDASGVAHHVIDTVGTTMLMLDDLQWADPSTLSILPMIAGSVRLLLGVRTEDRGTEAAETAARTCGAMCVRLDRLPEAVASAFLRSLNPDLSEGQLSVVLAEAEGLPFLLEELASNDSPTLLASLDQRLAPLGQEARDGLACLALLGRPADASLVGPSVSALIEAGLVREVDAQVRLRHDLIGAKVLSLLDPVHQRALHRELAAQVPWAEAARHHLAAGDIPRTRKAALRAADLAPFPSERARDLILAVDAGAAGSCSTPDERDLDLLLLAVDAFLEAGETAEAHDVLNRFDDRRRPEVELRRARLRWQSGDPEGARVAALRGLTSARGTGTPVEVALRLEEVKYSIRVAFDGGEAMSLAQEAWALASALGSHEARALTALGSASLVAGTDQWFKHLEAAIERAEHDADPEAGFEASNALVAARMLAGDRAIARSTATHAAQKAHKLGRRRWEEQFTITANFLAVLAGNCGVVAEWGRQFVRPHLTTAVQIAYAAYALALADLGFERDALKVLAEGHAIKAGDDSGLSLLRWAEAETHWLASRPREALEAADACLEVSGGNLPTRPLAQVVRSWAEYDLGLQPRVVDAEGWAFASAAKQESEGVVALAAGDPEAALGHFDASAAAAHDTPRFALRSQWGRAEALRLVGDTAGAATCLLALESAAAKSGLQAIRGRALKSLRAAGYPPTELRSDPSRVTQRQHEVLVLVAAGHTSAEIAVLLGVQSATVESHVRAAMERLGARTRQQAALLEIPPP